MNAATGVPIKPMIVQVGDNGPRRLGATVEDLMGMLMSDRWPDRSSPKFSRAMSACMDATVGGSGDRARTAFVDAAHDAGLAISPDDDRKAKPRRTDKTRTDRGAERSKQPLAGHLR
jgi:hypothetical protein